MGSKMVRRPLLKATFTTLRTRAIIKKATEGYEDEFGDKDIYKDSYRTSYLAGYRAGFASGNSV